MIVIMRIVRIVNEDHGSDDGHQGDCKGNFYYEMMMFHLCKEENDDVSPLQTGQQLPSSVI